MLPSLIFNIFLCNLLLLLFFFLHGVTVTTYADYTIPYSVNKTKDLVIKEIDKFPTFFFSGLT